MWTAHAQRDKTKADSLILVLATPAQVKLIVWDDILLNNEYHNINIYSEKCYVMWCFKCQKYCCTTSQHCWNRVWCDFYTSAHSTNDCMIKDSDKGVACVSCDCPDHSAWACDCSSQITEVIYAQEAYTVWLIHYQELALFLADLSSIFKGPCDIYQFSLSRCSVYSLWILCLFR